MDKDNMQKARELMEMSKEILTTGKCKGFFADEDLSGMDEETMILNTAMQSMFLSVLAISHMAEASFPDTLERVYDVMLRQYASLMAVSIMEDFTKSILQGNLN